MTAPAPARGFPIVSTVLMAVALAILVGLGVWQVRRLHWKEGLLAQIAMRQHAAPVPLAAALDRARRGEDVKYVRVKLTCPGLDRAPFVERYFVGEGGRAGWRLISGCPATGGGWSSVLVDRGFVDDANPVRPSADGQSHAAPELIGAIRAPVPPDWLTPAHQAGARRWFSMDTGAMAQTLGANVPAPVFVALETATNPDHPELKPLPLAIDEPNNHLGYALTWFGLALGLVAMYAAAMIKRFRRKSP